MQHRTEGSLVASIYSPLRLTYGLVPLLAGLDKLFNILADWPSYVSPLTAELLPVSPRRSCTRSASSRWST